MKKLSLNLLCVCSLLLNGCSAAMVVKGPSHKDLSVLRQGSHRNILINEFGSPELTETDENGNRIETWRFKQGDKKWVKVVKVPIYIAGDFFTLFASEILTMPFEMIMEEEMGTYIVTFDENNKVVDYQIIGAK